jgi:hypothetical protein
VEMRTQAVSAGLMAATAAAAYAGPAGASESANAAPMTSTREADVDIAPVTACSTAQAPGPGVESLSSFLGGRDGEVDAVAFPEESATRRDTVRETPGTIRRYDPPTPDMRWERCALRGDGRWEAKQASRRDPTAREENTILLFGVLCGGRAGARRVRVGVALAFEARQCDCTGPAASKTSKSRVFGSN